MFRVYTDLFYKDIEQKREFEERYIFLIRKTAENIHVKLRKNAKLVKLYSLIDSKIKRIHENFESSVSDFPKNFEKLLTLTPREIASIYVAYKKNENFRKTVDKELGMVYGVKNGKHFVLDFSKFSRNIAQFFTLPDNEKVININTCFYCNKTYINSYEIENSKKNQFDIDHFIPKSRCPLFSLSLYNFVPSCQVCNSRIKQAGEYYKECNEEQLEMLFPSSENYKYMDYLRFRIIPKKNLYQQDSRSFSFSEMKDSFAIEFEKLDEKKSVLFEKEANAFDIKKRYEYHKKEFLAYIDKLRKYPDSYFLCYANIHGINEANNLNEAIFNKCFRNQERQIFQKIYNDIDSQIE